MTSIFNCARHIIVALRMDKFNLTGFKRTGHSEEDCSLHALGVIKKIYAFSNKKRCFSSTRFPESVSAPG